MASIVLRTNVGHIHRSGGLIAIPCSLRRPSRPVTKATIGTDTVGKGSNIIRRRNPTAEAERGTLTNR